MTSVRLVAHREVSFGLAGLGHRRYRCPAQSTQEAPPVGALAAAIRAMKQPGSAL